MIECWVNVYLETQRTSMWGSSRSVCLDTANGLLRHVERTTGRRPLYRIRIIPKD